MYDVARCEDYVYKYLWLRHEAPTHNGSTSKLTWAISLFSLSYVKFLFPCVPFKIALLTFNSHVLQLPYEDEATGARNGCRILF